MNGEIGWSCNTYENNEKFWLEAFIKEAALKKQK
jgi:hypothetical protein